MAKNDDQEKTLTPKLRFPEFKDELGWQTLPLRELLSRPPEYGVNSAAVAYSPDLPTYIRITDIDDDGNFISANRSSVDIDASDNHYLGDGDVVFARTGASVGKSYRYRPEDGRLVFAGFLIRVRPDTNKLDSVFLSGFLATRQYWDWVLMTSARSGQPGINGTEYASLPIPLPSLAEQRKIAACLTSLDEWIAAEGRKLEALRAHKKGLMQQLFPQEGETRPQLRFPEFRDAGDWQERKIRSILTKKAEAASLKDQGIYREIGVRSHGKGLFHKEPTTGKAIGSKRVFHVVPDALVINIVFAWEQALAVTTQEECGFIASHRFPMFVPKQNRCDVRFIQRLFLQPFGKELLKVASPGGAGRNRTMSQKEFENLEVLIPEIAEQQRIAACLASLDALTDTVSQKLDALRDHKKGLMQQLFPSPQGE